MTVLGGIGGDEKAERLREAGHDPRVARSALSNVSSFVRACAKAAVRRCLRSAHDGRFRVYRARCSPAHACVRVGHKHGQVKPLTEQEKDRVLGGEYGVCFCSCTARGSATPAAFQAAWMRLEQSYEPGPIAPQTHGLPICPRAKSTALAAFPPYPGSDTPYPVPGMPCMSRATPVAMGVLASTYWPVLAY